VTDADGNEHEYPTAYGTACIGWNETLPPFCGAGDGKPFDDQPDFCNKPWCFINEKKCFKKDTQPSSYFPGTGLTYSYSQCNAEDTFTGYDPDAEEEEAPATTEEESTDSTGSGAVSMVFTTAAMAITTALMI